MQSNKCPVCGNKELVLGPSIKRWVNLIIFILFRPAWIVTVIYTYAVKKYRCGVCGKMFEKEVIETLQPKK